jgi:hypothetical protein
MIGSIEHALAEHQMQPDGKLWKSQVDDPAAGRECSSPFSLVPYRGRYTVEETTPNGLQMQVREFVYPYLVHQGFLVVQQCWLAF